MIYREKMLRRNVNLVKFISSKKITFSLFNAIKSLVSIKHKYICGTLLGIIAVLLLFNHTSMRARVM